MVKRFLVVLAGVISLALVRPAYLAGVSLNLWQPFTRPAGVSKRAKYVDAFKRAAWFDCSVDAGRNVNACRAWDPDGNLIAFGNYRLEGQNRAATARELTPWEVHPYPGHPDLAWIYLAGRNGGPRRTLAPVNDSGEPLEKFEVHISTGDR